jgi:hypothetical protein
VPQYWNVGIGIVLFSKGLSSKITNLNTKGVLIPIKDSLSQNSYFSVYTYSERNVQVNLCTYLKDLCIQGEIYYE